MPDFRQIELSEDEIRTVVAILRFSFDACPIESLPEEKIDRDTVQSLIAKFESVSESK